MASEDCQDWRAAAFRQNVIAQIDKALKGKENPNSLMKNPTELESQVYSKAKTRDDYLAYTARLLVYIREMQR